MKLLLDESIPRRLVSLFPEGFEVRTAQQMGWSGTSNGALLRLAADHAFDAFITADQGIEHQQDSANLPLTVIILVSYRTRFVDLQPLVPRVLDLIVRQPDIGIYKI